MNRRPQVLVTNVFGPLNRGDFELFEQLVTLLDGCDVHAIARDPHGAASYFPNVTFHPQPAASNGRQCKRAQAIAALRTVALSISDRIPIALKLIPQQQRSSLRMMEVADLVIACPGGYLTNATHSFYPQVAQLWAASRRSKELWFAPMSIGPATTVFERAFLRNALKGADAIYVRETWSQRFCASMGLTATISTDLAFLPAKNYVESTATLPKDCIAATVVRWNFPDSRDVEAATSNYHHAMAEALDRVSNRLNLPVKLLLQVDNDRNVSERVASLMRAPVEIVRVDTPEQYRQILGNAAIMFGSRFHSAIFAMCAGTPTVVISYLPKGRYMMEDMGLREMVIDIEDVTSDKLDEMATRIESSDSEYRHKMILAIESILSDAKNPFIHDLRTRLEELRRDV